MKKRNIAHKDIQIVQVIFYDNHYFKKNAEIKGMKKRIRCKADVEDEYRSNLMVVRISSKHPTQQIAFYSPRPQSAASCHNWYNPLGT